MGFRIPALRFGLPYLNHPDEPGNVLVGVRMAYAGDWDPHAFAYPALLFEVIAVGAWLYGLAGHGLSESGGISEAGLAVGRTSDPGLITDLRLISLLVSVGTCVLVGLTIYQVTRCRLASLVGGGLLAVSPLMIANGVFVTPDVYTAFLVSLTLMLAVRLARDAGSGWYCAAGAAVGLSAGAKYDVAAVAVSVVVAHVVHSGRSFFVRPTRWLPAPIAAIVVFVLINPAIVLDAHAFFTGAWSEATHYASGHTGSEGGSAAYYLAALWRDDPTALLCVVTLGVVGLLGAHRAVIIVLVSYSVAFAVLIATQTVHFDRNLMPLLPALAMIVGIGLASLPGLLPPRAVPVWLVCSTLAGALVCATVVPAAVRVPARLAERPRAEARQWLLTHLNPGARVIDEPYGPWLDPSRFQLTVTGLVAATDPEQRADAIVVTELGSGRFLRDPLRYQAQLRSFRVLGGRYRVAASFTDGPWVWILVPA